MKWIERLALPALIGGVILCWQAEGRWWFLALGLILMACGLAIVQQRRR